MSEKDDAAGAAFKIVLGFIFACIVVAAGIGVIIYVHVMAECPIP